MARYIDADKLIAEYDRVHEGPAGGARKLMVDAPTADVVEAKAIAQLKWERDTAIEQLQSYGVGFCEDKELAEVKHGEWHLLKDCANEGVYCSVCSKKVYKTDYANQKIKSAYCPNCGAKMDKKGGVPGA